MERALSLFERSFEGSHETKSGITLPPSARLAAIFSAKALNAPLAEAIRGFESSTPEARREAEFMPSESEKFDL